MINYDDVTKWNLNKHNRLRISNHPYRILVNGGSGSKKIYTLINLTKEQYDDDYSITNKIYLHAKDPCEAKYEYLIKKRENNYPEKLKDPKDFIEYSNNIEDVYQNIEDYNPIGKSNVLNVFDDMIADMISNK